MKKIDYELNEIKYFLVERGFKSVSIEGNGIYAYKELPTRRFCICVDLIMRDSELKAKVSVTFVPNRLGEAFNFIHQEKVDVFPSNSQSTEKWVVRLQDTESLREKLYPVIDECQSWVESCSFAERQKYLRENFHVAGSGQLWHIAALAVEEDIATLHEYISNIEKTNRGGLLPYITMDMLNRAIDFHWKYPNE